MGDARGHHFLPQCYLRGFSLPQRKKVRLIAFELATGRRFETTPHNVCKQHDFNRVDLPGVDPNVLEQEVAKFESLLAPVLVRLIETRQIEDEEQVKILLNFIAHLLTRNPSRRRRYDQHVAELGSMMLQAITSSPERFETAMAEIRPGSMPGDDGRPTYEEMRAFAQRTDLPTMGFDRTSHIGFELRDFDEALDLLTQRKWVLCEAAADAGTFITSDHPVCVVWQNADDRHPLLRPAIDMTNTVVVFPVASTLALTGYFDMASPPDEISNRHRTAITNSMVMGCADKQVYAGSTDFCFRSRFTGSVLSGTQLEAELARAAAMMR